MSVPVHRRRPGEAIECKWCGRRIIAAYAFDEGYWYHPHNQSVWCVVPEIGKPQSKRAEPVDT